MTDTTLAITITLEYEEESGKISSHLKAASSGKGMTSHTSGRMCDAALEAVQGNTEETMKAIVREAGPMEGIKFIAGMRDNQAGDSSARVHMTSTKSTNSDRSL